MNVFDRFKEAWAVFRGRDHPLDRLGGISPGGWYTGPSSSDRPDRLRMRASNERTIVNAVYNRIALDVAEVEIHHAKLDDNDFFQEAIKDSLEDLFTVEANIDQTSMSYTIDLVMSLFDEGVVAEIPVDMDESFDSDGRPVITEIRQIRTGKIVEWKPYQIKVSCYNETTGQKEEVDMMKRECAIIENPFYSIMNERNSVYQRLTRKLNVLDVIDQNYTGAKLNMILQLPSIVRTDVQREMARNRLKEIERSLKESEYGIAYVDGTEKVVNINRPLENNLQTQIEWLTKMFFSQLGVTEEILNGTADEKTMTNYMNRVISVVCQAICQERTRKWLTKDQRDNHEAIVFVQDPLKLIPVTSLADIFDKLNRNAILSPNESRGILGYKPSEDPNADLLMNRNMPIQDTLGSQAYGQEVPPEEEVVEVPEEDAYHSAFDGKIRRKTRKRVPRIYLRE